MLKKTITYTDFNGNERTEEFRFHLSKSKLVMLQNSVAGGFDKMIKGIADAQDNPKIMENFEKILRLAYGEISQDGRRFIQSDELSDAFMQTPAYDILFMELLGDESGAKMAEFINSLIPSDVLKDIQAAKTNA